MRRPSWSAPARRALLYQLLVNQLVPRDGPLDALLWTAQCLHRLLTKPSLLKRAAGPAHSMEVLGPGECRPHAVLDAQHALLEVEPGSVRILRANFVTNSLGPRIPGLQQFRVGS